MSVIDKLITACAFFVVGVVAFIGYHHFVTPDSGDSLGAKARPTPRIVRPLGGAAKSGDPKAILDKDKQLYEQLSQDLKAKQFVLTDVIGSNTSGNGFYFRGGGKLYVGAEVNMPEAPEGTIHQAWLMKELPRKQYVPLGRPQILGTGKFLVAKTITPSYPEFDMIVITLEATEDMTPERVVMQGKIE